MIENIGEQIVKSGSQGVIQRTYIDGNSVKTIKEVWTPKVKFFQPPMIPLFRWAYRIERTVEHSTIGHVKRPSFTQIGVIINNGGKDEC